MIYCLKGFHVFKLPFLIKQIEFVNHLFRWGGRRRTSSSWCSKVQTLFLFVFVYHLYNVNLEFMVFSYGFKEVILDNIPFLCLSLPIGINLLCFDCYTFPGIAELDKKAINDLI